MVAGRSSVDELALATGLGAATVLGALTALEIRGLVVEAYGRYAPRGRSPRAARGPGTRRDAAGRVTRRPVGLAPNRNGPEPTRVVSSRPFRPPGTEPPIERRWQPRDATWHPASHLEDDVLRKPGAVLLAAPVALGELVGTLIARSRVLRVGGVAGIAATIALLLAVASPSPGTAIPASAPALVSADLFVPIGTAHDPAAPFTVTFDQPMDHHSVAAALRVDPPTGYRLEWDSTSTRATLRPAGHWRADTLYQVVVGHGRHERRRRQPRRPAAQRRPHRHRRHARRSPPR